jgi:transcriptional regulator with XRE-family HTH domain
MSNTLDFIPTQETTIGGRIAQARRFNDLNQHELADSVGVSFRTIQNWERGNGMPSAEGIVKVANATGFPVLWFLEPFTVEFGCTHGQDPPPDGRYTQLSWVGGSYGNDDSPHVASTEPTAA